MAHVGKLYKLQFRRDLAMVANNVNAWAEAYFFNVLGIFGAKGQWFSNQNPICINTAKESQPPMTWSSYVFSNHGISWQQFVTCIDPVGDPTDDKHYVLEVTEIGLGPVITGIFLVRRDMYDLQACTPVSGSFVFAPGYDGAAPFLKMSGQAARWNFYP